MQTKDNPARDDRKVSPPEPPARPPLRSRTVNTITFVAGLTTAGIGLLGLLTRPGGTLNLAFILGGLLVTLAGLILLRRSSRS